MWFVAARHSVTRGRARASAIAAGIAEAVDNRRDGASKADTGGKHLRLALKRTDACRSRLRPEAVKERAARSYRP